MMELHSNHAILYRILSIVCIITTWFLHVMIQIMISFATSKWRLYWAKIKRIVIAFYEKEELLDMTEFPSFVETRHDRELESL